MSHATWRRFAGLILGCLLLAEPAAANETVTRLLSGVAAPLTARHGLVNEDAAAGTLIVYELQLARADGWSLKIAKLTAERLDESALARPFDPATPRAGANDPAPAPFARKLIADEIELKHGAGVWRAAQVVLDAPALRPVGRPVPSGLGGLLALDPLTELLPNLSAATIRFSKATELEGKSSARADQLALEGVDRGRISRMTGKLLEVQGLGKDGDNAAIASLSASGLELALIVAAAQGQLPATHTTLADAVAFEGLAISGPQGSFNLKEARLDKFALRGPRGPAGLAAADMAGWADLFGMATIGRFELRDLALNLPPTYEGGFDRLVLEGLDGERLRLLRSDNVRWRDGSQRMEQSSMELRDLVFGPLMAMLAAGGMPDANSENLLTLERFSVRGSTYEDPTTGRQRVDELTLGRFRHRGFLPTSLELRIGGVEVDVQSIGDTDSAVNDGRDFLIELGYDEVKLDFEFSFEWRPDGGGRISLKPVSLGVREAGKLALSIEVSGIDPAALGGTFDWTALMQASLVGISLRYEDESLFERILAYAAEEAERSVESARRKLLREIEKERRAHPSDPLMGKLLDAVAAFVRKPKSIEAKVAPTRPVAALKMMELIGGKRDRLARELNITIEANR
jgi:hypothetical protein